MKRLSHYIATQYLVITLLVTLSVTITAWLSQLLKFFQIVVSRAKHLILILKPALLMIPDLMAFVLPIAVFIGVLFTLNRMGNDRELVIMKASGMSDLQIAKPILGCVLAITLVLYAAGTHFLPHTFKQLKIQENELKSSHAGLVLHEGSFNPLPDGLTVYIRARGREEGQIHGIFVHSAKPGESPYVLTAESGKIINTENGPSMVLFRGARQEKNAHSGKISILYFEQAIRELLPQKAEQRKRSKKTHELTTPELIFYNQPDALKFTEMVRKELHQRLVSPLYGLVFSVIGLVLLLKGNFSRRASHRRLMASAFLVVIVEGIALGLQNLLVDNVFFLILHYAFPLGIMGGGLYLLWEQDPRFGLWMERWGL